MHAATALWKMKDVDDAFYSFDATPLPDGRYRFRVTASDRLSNPEGEALVFEMRGHLTQLFLERGATHLQIGRTYRYREGLRPEPWQLLEAIKRAVDPRGLVNPGALGLPGG